MDPTSFMGGMGFDPTNGSSFYQMLFGQPNSWQSGTTVTPDGGSSTPLSPPPPTPTQMAQLTGTGISNAGKSFAQQNQQKPMPAPLPHPAPPPSSQASLAALSQPLVGSQRTAGGVSPASPFQPSQPGQLWGGHRYWKPMNGGQGGGYG